MDQNSHESQQNYSREVPRPEDEAFNTGCWTLARSIGVVFFSGVASQMLRTPFGDWIQIPVVAVLIPIGLAYVWYSHFVVVAEQKTRRGLNVQNDELHK